MKRRQLPAFFSSLFLVCVEAGEIAAKIFWSLATLPPNFQKNAQSDSGLDISTETYVSIILLDVYLAGRMLLLIFGICQIVHGRPNLPIGNFVFLVYKLRLGYFEIQQGVACAVQCFVGDKSYRPRSSEVERI